MFKYGVPKEVLSDNGPQFASLFSMGVFQAMGITNSFTSTYHPQTNGKTERFNRTILQMIRCYVADLQRYWDVYFQELTYTYNTAVHRSTGNTLFELVLTNPPEDFALQGTGQRSKSKDADRRAEYVRRTEELL